MSSLSLNEHEKRIIVQETITDSPNIKIAVVGLGYVGLPLLCQLSRSFEVWGLDSHPLRIEELSQQIDSKRVVNTTELQDINTGRLTNDWKKLPLCDAYILAIPTPVDEKKQPDLRSLEESCTALAHVIKPGSVVVIESTVAPGTTNQICIPILESFSGMKLNKDFSVAYSPERINVGDYQHTIDRVPKIVAASNSATLEWVAQLYEKGLSCPVVRASSIKTAEATKLYENVQRDVLIALANQYSAYCREEGLDIYEITQCAATKWNFSEVYPGIAGGHCIGTDSYYLLAKAHELNVSQPLLSTARRVNEEVPHLVARRIIQKALEEDVRSILLLGAAYKANTGDTRNSKVFEVLEHLAPHFSNISIYDPLIDLSLIPSKYKGYFIANYSENQGYDTVVTLVQHKVFQNLQHRQVKMHLTIHDLL